MNKTKIIVRFSVEGLHRWEGCTIPEVDYLQHSHRHTFGIIGEVDVSHLDRDIEFIELSHKMKTYLAGIYYNSVLKLHVFGTKSCEMIAQELLTVFNLNKCEVNEDGENGAIVER